MVLQWVHGPRTVVMPEKVARGKRHGSSFNGSTVREPWLCTRLGLLLSFKVGKMLQWVHGPRTVVMSNGTQPGQERRRFNGSTVREPWLCKAKKSPTKTKKKGFNGSTVREPWLWGVLGQEQVEPGIASMGPRSENRGYDSASGVTTIWMPASMGPRSENRGYGWAKQALRSRIWASMGPRSENRGYVSEATHRAAALPRFNGSTVREPWLWPSAPSGDDRRAELQWVHGPRTVVMDWIP